ncbi:HPt (histidine-containing phosphotransfer) domain-containing protein [Alteromonadaceae bacterium Bs31]|nr:HPt (histidine-containing phosphotransfer) domain-containing protein [Alteromonadaceae bacterium Bs31]
MSDVDLDTGMLEGLRELLGEKFVELISTFNSDCRARLDRIKVGLEEQNFDVIRNESHGVKGSCRNMGANSLAALAGALEDKAVARDATEMEQLFSAAEQQFAAIADKLRALL